MLVLNLTGMKSVILMTKLLVVVDVHQVGCINSTNQHRFEKATDSIQLYNFKFVNRIGQCHVLASVILTDLKAHCQ